MNAQFGDGTRYHTLAGFVVLRCRHSDSQPAASDLVDVLLSKPEKKFSLVAGLPTIAILFEAATAKATLLVYDLRYDPFLGEHVTLDSRIYFDDTLIANRTTDLVVVDHFDLTFHDDGLDRPGGPKVFSITIANSNRTDGAIFDDPIGPGKTFVITTGRFDAAGNFTGQAVVPETSSILLCGLGLAGLVGIRRRR